MKSLARQTTNATEGISREITAMRNTAPDGGTGARHEFDDSEHDAISDELSQQSEELASSVDVFLTIIRN